MQTTIDYTYGDIQLELLVDYDEDGITLEEVHHKGEDISELLAEEHWVYLRDECGEKLLDLLESDKISRAEEAWERRKDK